MGLKFEGKQKITFPTTFPVRLSTRNSANPNFEWGTDPSAAKVCTERPGPTAAVRTTACFLFLQYFPFNHVIEYIFKLCIDGFD